LGPRTIFVLGVHIIKESSRKGAISKNGKGKRVHNLWGENAFFLPKKDEGGVSAISVALFEDMWGGREESERRAERRVYERFSLHGELVGRKGGGVNLLEGLWRGVEKPKGWETGENAVVVEEMMKRSSSCFGGGLSRITGGGHAALAPRWVRDLKRNEAASQKGHGHNPPRGGRPKVEGEVDSPVRLRRVSEEGVP